LGEDSADAYADMALPIVALVASGAVEDAVENDATVDCDDMGAA